MPRKTKLIPGLFALSVTATILGVASPAQAADPVCNVSGTVNNRNGFPQYIPKNSTTGVNCTLRSGDHSNGVGVLKTALRVCYGKNIAQSNSFDAATRTALIQVQTQVGISADGVYGRETRDNIVWKVRDGGHCEYYA
ncbi:hypothetical protein Cme02nite_24550 [Catellatospora methionotrophica]|uniref:Peptidoglycan binding-like domain-containing protein n=1 Tax=Catellatospora methionotrophica TaxID=121620 RepID=A0A8J3L4D8_9ACTN|nr:peptidoglycan-binding protein [Catellatospora methionotrophica]GIG14123.1 hypothetical protein Cme02nite_24550 [Catellatospora methionotrophica]